MELRQLRYFAAVAEARSFTAAALELHVSQPALSQSILRLEHELDCTLFLRNKQNPGVGLVLTPAGRSLREDAAGILEAARRAEGRARRAGHDVERIRVAIGFASSTPSHLTLAAVKVPSVEVLPVHLVWGEEHAALRSGRVDVAFMQYPVGAAAPDYAAVGMALSPRVALLPAGHALATRPSVSVLDIAGEPILDPGFGDTPEMNRDYWLGEPRPHHGDGPVVVGPPVRTVEEMCAFVAAGKGMAITSGMLAEHYQRADLAFVPIEDLEPVEVGLVRLRDDRRPQVVEVFEQLKKYWLPGRHP
ncbi:LysR family transcriptional regulator [Amycolatopsis jejuensis]|uniref:LysR family transcriptional regulator n=1 Tax=Amycolatopsis jejuensis TaxID=330084 RepID=UPI000527BF0C|nr:LysR family transcriptional regulator [Amycolatopsis jejuensis]